MSALPPKPVLTPMMMVTYELRREASIFTIYDFTINNTLVDGSSAFVDCWNDRSSN